METGTNLQQAGYPPPDGHPPFCRLCDAAQNFQQRAFPGSITADDAHGLIAINLKAHILERSNIFY